eukprot:987702_1
MSGTMDRFLNISSRPNSNRSVPKLARGPKSGQKRKPYKTLLSTVCKLTPANKECCVESQAKKKKCKKHDRPGAEKRFRYNAKHFQLCVSIGEQKGMSQVRVPPEFSEEKIEPGTVFLSMPPNGTISSSVLLNLAHQQMRSHKPTHVTSKGGKNLIRSQNHKLFEKEKTLAQSHTESAMEQIKTSDLPYEVKSTQLQSMKAELAKTIKNLEEARNRENRKYTVVPRCPKSGSVAIGRNQKKEIRRSSKALGEVSSPEHVVLRPTPSDSSKHIAPARVYPRVISIRGRHRGGAFGACVQRPFVPDNVAKSTDVEDEKRKKDIQSTKDNVAKSTDVEDEKMMSLKDIQSTKDNVAKSTDVEDEKRKKDIQSSGGNIFRSSQPTEKVLSRRATFEELLKRAQRSKPTKKSVQDSKQRCHSVMVK